MTPQRPTVELFYSYSHKDEGLRDQLATHLSMLKREGTIESWYDRRVGAGREWAGQIDKHLNSADITLLLVSADFIASDYCYDVEVKRAMERHAAGEARVIPIILRPCDWEGAPFSELQALPAEARPITTWENQDVAFLNVAEGIRKAIKDLLSSRATEDTPHDDAEISTIPADIPRPPIVGFVARRDRGGRDITERLREELAPSRDQLVVLWGAGGVGKTELAAEAARKLSGDFKGRVVWVTADAREDLPFTTLLDEIARQLGDEELRRLAPEQKAEAVSRLINSAPTLVVLDNFETISSAEEEMCKEFLSRRARCSVLITSRQRIEHFRSVPIEAMLPEEADVFLLRLIEQSPDRAIYMEAIRTRIIQTAEANPLIIEWIVGQIDLANDPEEVLDELVHGEGDAANRVFDRSFNLPQLKNEGRAVLLTLSLFVPSASRSALAAVANLELSKGRNKERFKKARETLASLWLIKTADAGQRLTVAGLTRELTKARLARDPRAANYRQRLISYFLRHAENNSQDTAAHLNNIETEKGNILNAMDVAFETRDWKSVTRIRHAVNDHLFVRGYWDEAMQSGEQALTAARNLSNESEVAAFTYILAYTQHNRGEVSEARRLYGESLEIYKKLGIQYGFARTLHQIAWLEQDEGNIDAARRLYIESLEIEESLGDQTGIAHTLYNLAGIAHDQGDLEEARRLRSKALAIRKRLGDQRGIASALSGLGLLAHERGDLEAARRLYEESLEIQKKLGYQDGIASMLHQLAILAQDQGAVIEARRLYGESLAIKRRLGDQLGIAVSVHQLGTISSDEGGFEEADDLYRQSFTLLRKLGHKNFMAECLESIGKLRMAQNSVAEARELFAEALKLAETVKHKFRIASIKRSLGLLAEKEGDWEKAAELLREALGVFEELKSPKAGETKRDLERLSG